MEKNIGTLSSRAVGLVLATQVHVLDALFGSPPLSWGFRYGPFYRKSAVVSAGAFSLPLDSTILWQSADLDVALLSLPSELLDECRCTGFQIADLQEGIAQLIGYPILGRRVFPHKSKWRVALGEVLGRVQQMTSTGRIWQSEDGTIFGDIDALPGNFIGSSRNASLNLNSGQSPAFFGGA